MSSLVRTETTPFQSHRELEKLVQQFQDCTLQRSEWDHRAHLSVASWYLFHLDEAEATERTIQGILRFNRAQGISASASGGYHETITLFWLALTRRHILHMPESSDVVGCVNGLIERYAGRKDLIFRHYSRERVFSWKARRTWVPPDLKPL